MYFYQTFSPPGIKKVVKILFLPENMSYIYTGIDYQKEQRCIAEKEKIKSGINMRLHYYIKTIKKATA